MKTIKHSPSKTIRNTLLSLVLLGVGVQQASAILTFDIRATQVNGVPIANPKSVEGLDTGAVVSFNLFAVVTGAPGVATLEGFTNGYGSLLSTVGGARGNLGDYQNVGNFAGAGSQAGLLQDLNLDGFMDIGSNAVKSTSDASPLLSGTNLIFIRAPSVQTAGTPITDGQEFLVGTFKFTLADAAGQAPTTVSFRVPTFTTTSVEALWQEDGGPRNSNGGGGGILGVGAPVQLIAVPEPSVAVTLLGGIATLLGLRRRKH